MEVKNHRTGETCVLSFKARGWRAKDACEIKGVVKDAEDRIAWDIAGREPSFLFPFSSSSSLLLSSCADP